LAIYCTSIAYLRQMREGAARIGLDGEPAGVVTADEAEDAARRLADYMAGTAEQPVEAPPQRPVGGSKPVLAPPQNPVDVSKPVEAPIVPAPLESAPAPPVAPAIAKRRLGLADLRAAAARRRQAVEAS
jgi:sRNA-binding protein